MEGWLARYFTILAAVLATGKDVDAALNGHSKKPSLKKLDTHDFNNSLFTKNLFCVSFHTFF
jgi:hypothetical protein